MPKPKYTLVEMQTASAGLITGLDKATQRVSNLEGIAKRYYKLRKRDTNTERTQEQWNITKGATCMLWNIRQTLLKTIMPLKTLDSCQTSHQRSRELRTSCSKFPHKQTEKSFHSQALGNQR